MKHINKNYCPFCGRRLRFFLLDEGSGLPSNPSYQKRCERNHYCKPFKRIRNNQYVTYQ